ncbi:MAG: PepSY-associated TM helix domain-containing protein [Rhizobiaceae bacterium]
MSSTTSSPQPVSASGAKLYRAVWRWHFYAGLYVIPFLIMLSVTGLMMLWFTTVAPEYGERIVVVKTTETMSITALSEAVSRAYPYGKIGHYIAPYGADNPAIFRIDSEQGNHMIAVDPYNGAVLKDTLENETWNEFATNIHGKLLWGEDGGPGDTLIEIAASLGILLIATGIYLWWPRGMTTWREALVPRFSANGRAFWKSLHSSIGAWAAVVLLFFLVSGLAWTNVWGSKYVQAWSTFPAEKWDNVPSSAVDHASMNHGAEKEVPWTLEQTLMPASGSSAGITGLPEGTPVVLESVVALGRAIGFQGRFQVTAPADEKGVWTLSQDTMSYDTTDPFSDRTVHVDQYSGKILATAAFADYPVLGKAMAVGIALHEGQTGWWNIIANALFCFFIILLCISGIVMWWLRRPAKQLGSPLYASDTRVPAGLLVIGALIAAAFPLGGAAMIAFAIIDFLLPTRWKQTGRAA